MEQHKAVTNYLKKYARDLLNIGGPDLEDAVLPTLSEAQEKLKEFCYENRIDWGQKDVTQPKALGEPLSKW